MTDQVLLPCLLGRDHVIASLEMLDGCVAGSAADHTLSWDHFRKALRLANIRLTPKQTEKIIHGLDKQKTGTVCWMDMVSSEKPQPPYFFDGIGDLQMRQLMCRGWPELLEKCKQREIQTRRSEKGLLPSVDLTQDEGEKPAKASGLQGKRQIGTSTAGGLPIQYFEECLGDTPELNLSRDDPKAKPIIKKIVDVCTKAFIMLDKHGKEMKDRNEKKIIDYRRVCQHYAGPSFDAEKEFDKKWEVIIEVLKELKDANAGRQLSRDQFRKRLNEGELHISDSTIEFLLRGQAPASVDMDTVCWRTARKTVQNILRTKWNVLMKLFRQKDPHGRRRLEKEVVRGILGRANVGMSNSLIEIVMTNLNLEDDKSVDYDALLSGKMKRDTFNMEVYVAYKTMESNWEQLSQHFWDFDTNADGKVSPDEFRMGLRSLNHPALQEASVLDQLSSYLADSLPSSATSSAKDADNFVDFDKFSWEMAREELRRIVAQRGKEMRNAFREEASLLYSTYHGQLPRDRAIRTILKAVEDLGVKEIIIKILISNAQNKETRGSKETKRDKGKQADQAAAGKQGDQQQQQIDRRGKRPGGALIEEAQFTETLRELAGDSFDKQEQVHLRQQFMDMVSASKYDAMDSWRLRGEDGREPKKLWGAASIGADAMIHAGSMPLVRKHMHAFFGAGGKSILPTMIASPALVEIATDRTENIYSGKPWKTFWEARESYRSPALPMSATPPPRHMPGTSASRAGSAPMHDLAASGFSILSSAASQADPRGSAKHPSQTQVKPEDRLWEVARNKIRKAMFEKFQSNTEALAALDPSSPGATGAISTQVLRSSLAATVPGLGAAELDAISERMDPGHDGMVLKVR